VAVFILKPQGYAIKRSYDVSAREKNLAVCVPIPTVQKNQFWMISIYCYKTNR